MAFVAVGLSGCLFGGSDLAPGVKKQGIRRLRLGMTEEKVTSILGAPLKRTMVEDGFVVLTYSRPPPYGPRNYPMLWVKLDRNALTSVSANQYVLWGTDHSCVYFLDDYEPQGWASAEFEDAFPN